MAERDGDTQSRTGEISAAADRLTTKKMRYMQRQSTSHAMKRVAGPARMSEKTTPSGRRMSRVLVQARKRMSGRRGAAGRRRHPRAGVRARGIAWKAVARGGWCGLAGGGVAGAGCGRCGASRKVRQVRQGREGNFTAVFRTTERRAGRLRRSGTHAARRSPATPGTHAARRSPANPEPAAQSF